MRRKPREYNVTVEWVKDDLPHSIGDKETVTIEATSENAAREIAGEKYGDVVKIKNIEPRRNRWYGR